MTLYDPTVNTVTGYRIRNVSGTYRFLCYNVTCERPAIIKEAHYTSGIRFNPVVINSFFEYDQPINWSTSVYGSIEGYRSEVADFERKWREKQEQREDEMFYRRYGFMPLREAWVPPIYQRYRRAPTVEELLERGGVLNRQWD